MYVVHTCMEKDIVCVTMNVYCGTKLNISSLFYTVPGRGTRVCHVCAFIRLEIGYPAL